MGAQPLIAILADDLIWATRLDRIVRDAGARPSLVRSAAALDAALSDAAGPPTGVIVDLTGRGYDGIAAVGRAAAAGVPVAAVGQHDDRDTRQAAREAGASVVFAYGRLYAGGPPAVEGWLRTVVAP